MAMPSEKATSEATRRRLLGTLVFVDALGVSEASEDVRGVLMADILKETNFNT